jgi:pimeloyl-ACP methyl ester carboxylesterase
VAREGSAGTWPFLAGITFGGALAGAWSLLRKKPRLDPRILRALPRGQEAPMVVFVPGLLGSELLRKDGSMAWLNLGNTFGHHDLSLPRTLPLSAARDELHPGLLIGTDYALPRAFGFTEYADLLQLLDGSGYEPGVGKGLRYAVYTYDWRRDIVESARGLARRLEGLAQATGDPDARFHLIGHSMGGLLVRWYLRYGGAEPRANAPVTWAGARRAASAVLTATPNAGCITVLAAILGGERVGFSYTTLAASVVSRMPSVYQLLPPAGTPSLVDAGGGAVGLDLHDAATWERFEWGPFAPRAGRKPEERAFLEAVLERAKAFHAGLAATPAEPCPVPVHALGSDCLPTPARAIVGEGARGSLPRFVARSGHEQEFLFEPGDGRVTRASQLATQAATDDDGDRHGIPELSGAFFGSFDHHGLFCDPAFQNLLLRLLRRRAPARLARSA